MLNRLHRLADEVATLRREQGRVILPVPSVDEAVVVAERLREIGQAQWFRGQVRNYPKLTPSLYRLTDDEFARAKEAMYRFDNWVKSTPGFDELAASPDAMFAVAQHYGMPTAFLDFSIDPRVAAYFASVHPNPPALGTESCIYCLDINEADSIWGVRPGVDPERVVLDVPNLWRLEAQSGIFVFCRYDDLNAPFPLDRITFPYNGPVSAPTDAEIYPERESPLEARLREYFQSEAIIKGSVVFEEIKRHANLSPQVFDFDAPSIMREYFLAPPAPHPSWTDSEFGAWLKVPREIWSDVRGAPSMLFETKLEEIPDVEATRFESEARAALQANRALRQSKLEFKIAVEGCDVQTVQGISNALQRVWDEMARLPWTDEQIALALSAVLRCSITQHALQQSEGLSGMELERTTMSRILFKPLRVEMGGPGNVHTFAWVEEDDLLAAVRPDFEQLLRPEHRDQILGDTFNTLMVSRSPSYLFDFGKLSELFAREMIPTQAVFYPDHPLFPTPARVQVIGPE